MSHAKAKLTPAGRLLLVERIELEGWPPAHAAKMCGVSRATAYKWLARWRAEGIGGLKDRSSRPHSMPSKTTPEVEARVCELRRSWRRGPHLIGGRLDMAPSTVHAILARHGLSRLSRLDRVTGDIIRYERDHPGDLIHVDVKKLGRIPDGGGWRVHGRAAGRPAKKRGRGYDFLHVAIDDHSRIAFVQIHGDEKGTTCAGFLTDAFEFFDQLGITVHRVMTDNAKNYVESRAFQDALDWRKHQRIRPYRPQTNGKVERFNRTLTTEWAYARVFNSNDERADTLDDWVRDYNYNRTHSAIGNRPPSSRLPSTT